MKYDTTLKMFGYALAKLVKKDIKDKIKLTAIKAEYKAILIRASDIGNHNNLLMSYTLCAFFIAMCRKDGLTPDENIKILESSLKNSKLVKSLMGNKKSYFSDKHMKFLQGWSKETQNKKYKNDWVVNFIKEDDKFKFGLDYIECGVCKLCRDENCFELAKYLCQLDFMLAELIGVKLVRTKTLADGNECCDFRYLK